MNVEGNIQIFSEMKLIVHVIVIFTMLICNFNKLEMFDCVYDCCFFTILVQELTLHYIICEPCHIVWNGFISFQIYIWLIEIFCC